MSENGNQSAPRTLLNCDKGGGDVEDLYGLKAQPGKAPGLSPEY